MKEIIELDELKHRLQQQWLEIETEIRVGRVLHQISSLTVVDDHDELNAQEPHGQYHQRYQHHHQSAKETSSCCTNGSFVILYRALEMMRSGKSQSFIFMPQSQ